MALKGLNQTVHVNSPVLAPEFELDGFDVCASGNGTSKQNFDLLKYAEHV